MQSESEKLYSCIGPQGGMQQQHSLFYCHQPHYLTSLVVWFHCSSPAWAIIEFDLVEIPGKNLNENKVNSFLYHCNHSMTIRKIITDLPAFRSLVFQDSSAHFTKGKTNKQKNTGRGTKEIIWVHIQLSFSADSVERLGHRADTGTTQKEMCTGQLPLFSGSLDTAPAPKGTVLSRYKEGGWSVEVKINH